MSRTYLLTGGTGFLGSLLSLELLKRGDRVIFLGRSKPGETLEKRIKAKLLSIEPALSLSEILFFEMDLLQEDLGLSQHSDKFSGKIDGFWHLAASLSFKEKDRKETFATNVRGVKNILNFASKINCPVYYVGTAYVHGKRPGKIFEADLLKPKKGFNNPYEESKFEAEKTVKEWGEKRGGKFIIFRPSILIEENPKSFSLFGYYAVLSSLLKLRKSLGKKADKIIIPFPYFKKSVLNLMPVNLAINWMMRIADDSRTFGSVFHITNPAPFLIKDMAKQTFGAAGIRIFLFSVPRWFTRLYFSIFCFLGSLFKATKGIARKFGYYKYYIVEDNYYDMSNVKKILGDEEINKITFPENFIYKLARSFIWTCNL